jgi:hypothetical protein
MKLYDAYRNTMVKVIDDLVTVPPGMPGIQKGEVFKFHHIDGMYSYCHDEEGNVVHLPAWCEVEYVDG